MSDSDTDDEFIPGVDEFIPGVDEYQPRPFVPPPWMADDASEIQMPSPIRGLHPTQQQVADSDARFKVVATGRRWGKTWYGVKEACRYARMTHWPDGTDLKGAHVWYISPTIDLALEQVEPLILEELGEECVKHHKVKNFFELENGCRIYLKSGTGDNLRGRALRFVVIDELSTMRLGLWELIVRPMLVDYVAPALLIGSVKSRGKLWQLYKAARDGLTGWAGFQFKTVENPHISRDEVASAAQDMTARQFRQEFEADFDSAGGSVFTGKDLRVGKFARGIFQIAAVFGSDDPIDGDEVTTTGTESAIIVAVMHPLGWHVIHAQRGFWGVAETIKRISDYWTKYRPRYLALSEKDNRISENLFRDWARHGGARVRQFPIADADMQDRIKWALQSRLKAGKVTCVKGRGRQQLADQLQDFPLAYTNDELVKALSYLDQLPTPHFQNQTRRRFVPLDRVAGY